MKYTNMIKEKIRKVKEEMDSSPKYLSGKTKESIKYKDNVIAVDFGKERWYEVYKYDKRKN